jgi:signal transduction histidine kinase/CheY-like chemotaxis protein
MLDSTRLTRLFAILNEPAPLDRLLDRVVATLAELFAADIVLLQDPARTGSFVPVAQVGFPGHLVTRLSSGFDSDHLALAVTAALPAMADGATTDPVVEALLAELGVQSAVWLPVRGSSGVRGLLLLGRCRPADFAQSDIDLLMSMAHRIGLALEQAERSLQLERIARFGREVVRELDEAALARAVADVLPEIVGATAAAVMLTNPDGRCRCAGASPGFASTWRRDCERFGQWLVDKPPAVSAIYSTRDVRGEPDLVARGFPGEAPVRALMAVPIERGGARHGFLIAMRFTAVAFASDTASVATLVAGQLSAAIENARLYRAARDAMAERLRAEADRERLEDELRATQKRKAIATFAGGIAHDFNNLLLVVMGNLELAKADLDRAAPSRRLIDHALNASSQAVALTKKFLSFSERSEPKTTRTDTRSLITDAVSLALSGSNVAVEFDLADGLWDLDVDESQIAFALGAIVVNARESMPAGGTITVTAWNLDNDMADSDPTRPRRFVEAVIEDRGRGISPDQHSRIFDPYYSTKQRGAAKGMGLGLAITQSIIARHGGAIRVESTPGVGTTVMVTLPATMETAVKAPAPPAPVCSATFDASAVRVLLLEDEDGVATMTEQMLRRLGYGFVDRARTGEEAIALLDESRRRGTPTTVAILDLTVRGGMGGRETLPKLLEIDPALTAVVSSGYSVDPVIAHFRDFGFAGALPKPFGLEELDRVLRSVLGLSAS